MSQSSDCPSEHAKRLLDARIQLISKEWADDIWDGDFTDLVCEWPDELADSEGDTKYWRLALERFLVASRDWPPEKPGFWLCLVENDVSPRVLIAFLYCIMEKHSKVHVGVLAAHIYLILNPIVGSSAYKVFHSLLFEKAVNFVRLLSTFTVPNGKKKKKLAAKASRGKGTTDAGARSGGRRRAVPTRGTSVRIGSMADGGDDDVEEERENDADQDSSLLEEGADDPLLEDVCLDLMQDIATLFEQFSLKTSEHCLQQIIVLYVEMLHTQVAINGVAWNMDKQAISQCTSSPELAAVTILKLCQPFHGAPTASILLTFKHLRPTFLMSWLSVQAGCVPPALVASSVLALQLVRRMVKINPEICIQSLQILFQHLCASAPSRSDLRSRLAQTVVEMASIVSTGSRVFLTIWLIKYSKSNKTAHRVFACDVLGHMLMQRFPPVEESLSVEDRHVLSDLSLLRCIFSRCSDKSASVRAHALAVLAEIGPKFRDSICLLLQETTDNGPGPCHANIFIPMVVRRSGDEKAIVRKSALQALELLVSLSSVATEVLQALRDRCRDPALSVRKQALSSLSGLLQQQGEDSQVQKLWLEAVLPMVLDRETSVKQRCCQLLQTYILKYIETAVQSESSEHDRAWSMLSHIAAKESTELRRYFQRVVNEWAIERILKPPLLKSLVDHITTDKSKASWMFLAEISPHTPLPNVRIALDAWKKADIAAASDAEVACFILAVLSGNSQQLSSSQRSSVAADLLMHLLNFKSELSLVASMIQTLSKLSKDSTDEAEAVRQPWAVKILQACQKWLTEHLLSDSTSQMEETDLICRLFTLGEAAQLCPACVSEQLFLLVQSLLASPKETQLSSSHSTLSSSPLVRAHAFVTLGKLCLQQETLAKKCVIVLVRELETSDDAIVRNNVVIILCDLCVRYTQLVDNYLSSISACLRDDSPLVSHQTLMSLTLLLKEDYIKWKGSLFFRYLMCIVAENPKSCEFAEYCLVHLLLARHQILFSTQFMECLFHYNTYEQHPAYNKFVQTDKEKRVFSLKGDKHLIKRRKIYQFLLQHMTDEQRFGITAKLCQEVLSSFVDGTLSLKNGGSDVLADALYILCCPEIKLSSLRVRTADDLEDEMEQANVAAANAKSKLVTQLVRKNVMENIMPIIIDLKHMLEHKRSPLLRELMHFLQELMKDYRNDVQDILSADRQLAREIEYDLKKFEEEEERRAACEASVVAKPCSLTPHTQMMSPLLGTPVVSSPHAIMSPAAGFSFPRIRGARPAPATPADLLRENMRQRAAAAADSVTRTPGAGTTSSRPARYDMPPPSPGAATAVPPSDASPTLTILPAAAATTTPAAKKATLAVSKSSASTTSAVSTPRLSATSVPASVTTTAAAQHTPVPADMVQAASVARHTLASVGHPALARAVSTPQNRDSGQDASLSFRGSINGLIPPSPILPMARIQVCRRTQAQAGNGHTSDGRPLVSIPGPQAGSVAPSQWDIASPKIPSAVTSQTGKDPSTEAVKRTQRVRRSKGSQSVSPPLSKRPDRAANSRASRSRTAQQSPQTDPSHPSPKRSRESERDDSTSPASMTKRRKRRHSSSRQ
ncbi:condensin-2 complex subunit D3-L-like isoform X1 [Sycon ciliatum]|uniref:condensin-2 complex subunit D3-L-like isoform X1 n=1 Tax=Sycon ciliatum TaxID=27933 RepID=UPI0031F61304